MHLCRQLGLFLSSLGQPSAVAEVDGSQHIYFLIDAILGEARPLGEKGSDRLRAQGMPAGGNAGDDADASLADALFLGFPCVVFLLPAAAYA